MRRRGLMSHSRWKTCCQVPRTNLPSLTGTVSDDPSVVACRCEWPLPSCHACSWQQLVQHCRQVLLEARLELNRADCASAADVEDVNEPAAHARLAYNPGDLAGEVMHLPVAGGLDSNLLLVNHAFLLPGTQPSGQRLSREAGWPGGRYQRGGEPQMDFDEHRFGGPNRADGPCCLWPFFSKGFLLMATPRV